MPTLREHLAEDPDNMKMEIFEYISDMLYRKAQDIGISFSKERGNDAFNALPDNDRKAIINLAFLDLTEFVEAQRKFMETQSYMFDWEA